MYRNKEIEFSTGRLVINDTSISFHQRRGNANHVNTIGRENIGHLDKQRMRLLPKTDVVYCFQIAAIGIIAIILGFIMGGLINNFGLAYLGFALLFFGAALLLCVIWVDALLGIKVAEPILLAIYGVNVIRVVVQNIYGGNNLQFFVGIDEELKIPDFETYKTEKIYVTQSLKPADTKSSSFDDIEKLAELRDKGVLSQEEFESKKKQILGL